MNGCESIGNEDVLSLNYVFQYIILMYFFVLWKYQFILPDQMIKQLNTEVFYDSNLKVKILMGMAYAALSSTCMCIFSLEWI